jgi:hypothetical protein
MIVRSVVLLFVTFSFASAQSPTVRMTAFHNHSQAIKLTHGKTTAIVSPWGGGRVLSFVVGGVEAMQLDDAEKTWQRGKPSPTSAGRFDYGPELTVVRHPKTWGGDWTGEIVGTTARLTGPRDESGIQLVREFSLISHGESVGLACKQTMTNICNETREVCHWGRSFSPGGGICVIPLGERPSRFPAKYAMYEDGSIINVRNKDEQIRERDGFLEILAPPRKPKLGFDSYAGWLAYVLPSNAAFVKRFVTHPDRVYNEAAGLTISVWYPQGPRIELEPIGPRERLKPGESASFTEEWWVVKFPYPKQGDSIDLKALNTIVQTHTSNPR